MNTNKKLIILIALIISSLSAFIYLQTINSNVEKEFKSYEKTANEIAIIKKLKNYYGDKKKNKRKIYNIIAKYKNQTLSKKETKKTLEFTINKLNHKQLDDLNKKILNSGVKVIKLSLIRTNANIGELYCKVMF